MGTLSKWESAIEPLRVLIHKAHAEWILFSVSRIDRVQVMFNFVLIWRKMTFRIFLELLEGYEDLKEAKFHA